MLGNIMLERLDILRRIAERGKKDAEYCIPGDAKIDIWIHMLDEIERTRIEYEKEIGERRRMFLYYDGF